MVRVSLPDPSPLLGRLGQALLAGIGGVFGSYALAGATPEFIAAPVGGFLSRQLPSVVITVAILVLGELGQQLNLFLSVCIAIGLFGGAALFGGTIKQRTDSAVLGVAAALVTAWVIAVLLTGAPIGAVGAAVGTGAVFAMGEVLSGIGRTYRDPVDIERRRFLGSLVGVLGTVLVTILGGDRLRALGADPASMGAGSQHGGEGVPRPPAPGVAEFVEDEADQSAIDRLLTEASEKSLDVDGIEPLVSERFYEVDINPVNPTVDAEEWTLSVTGAVKQELEIGYAELFEVEPEHRFVTLRCVGEPLNGQQMDTAVWTGIPVESLLERAVPDSDCGCVMLRAADDYYEQFPLAALRGGLLAYGMNGEALPREHGYPLRALIPGHWGEINVKWLTEIEFLEREQEGYWEERGWHGTGPVETVAKLHAVNRDDDTIEVGGHAYAGTRGIRTVRVSTDGGDSWNEAELSEPLPGDDVWRQWRYVYDEPGEAHEVVVYAIDGEGNRQSRERSNSFPSGPSGWVRRHVENP